MSDIAIDTTKGPVSLNLAVNSMQVVGYVIKVLEPDGSSVRERYTGSIGANKSSPLLLENKLPYSKCYFTATISVVDPNGAGNNYSVVFSVQQQNADLNPTITMSGTTTNKESDNNAIFHVS